MPDILTGLWNNNMTPEAISTYKLEIGVWVFKIFLKSEIDKNQFKLQPLKIRSVVPFSLRWR